MTDINITSNINIAEIFVNFRTYASCETSTTHTIYCYRQI